MQAYDQDLINTAKTQYESGIKALPQDKKKHSCTIKASTARKKIIIEIAIFIHLRLNRGERP